VVLKFIIVIVITFTAVTMLAFSEIAIVILIVISTLHIWGSCDRWC
jgi:hypothetical protein